MSPILPQTVYRRSKEPNQLPAALRLRALEWALYFAATGKHTAAELGRTLRTAAADHETALQRLLSLGLIEERELDASEYVRALATTGDEEQKTLHEFLLGSARPPLRAVPAEPPRPARPSFPFQPLPAPDARKDDRMNRKLSLRALMSWIERHAGSREAAQLDTYRVFVRIDTVLLKRNGIETLQFTEDRLISDPELEQALVRSVKKTLGLDCPGSVWVEVA